MSKPVSSFPFDRLRKYSRQEADLLSNLVLRLPFPGDFSPLLLEIGKTLQKYLGGPCPLRYAGLHETEYGKFLSGLPEYAVCPVVSLTPLAEKVIIAVNSHLAFALIDRLLGGEEHDALDFSRKLTGLEEGILQYFFVKILQKIGLFFEKGSFCLQLDQIVTSRDRLENMEKAEAVFYLVRFAFALGPRHGMAEVGIPQSLLKNLEAHSSLFKSGALASPAFEEERFRHWEHFRTVFWAEAGRAVLTAQELALLERGDIILFDEIYPDYDGSRLTGRVQLRVGEGSAGGFEATIVETEKTLKLKIEDIFHE